MWNFYRKSKGEMKMRKFRLCNLAVIRSGKRRSLTIILGILVSLALLTNTAGAAGTSAKAVNVIMDGIKYPLTTGHPYLDNGITMIPFRMISGKLGIQSDWNASTKTLTLMQKSNKIVLTVGSSYAKVNGVPTGVGAMVVQKDGVTMIPLTVVRDLLSAEVEVKESTQSIYIRTPGKDPGNLDYFGRRIRTTNLPKNYKDYPYILEDIPNEMYEMEHTNIYYADDAKTGAKMFSSNKITFEDMEKISYRMKLGYDMRLNVDYKTIHPENYAKEAYSFESQVSSYRIELIKRYAEWVIKNKIQIEGSIDPEPSMIYSSGVGWLVRSKVRFRINSFSEYRDLLDDAYLKLAKLRITGDMKKGAWYEGYADVRISSNQYDGAGYDGEYGENKRLNAISSLFESSTLYEMK
ncbi:copper amine oxidase N-terminal domain-containing protein [Paenibacillus sp. IHB B 3415]|uniref:copper amine oxidase N-terminal domain-containing protein n=1 Tax=Paenibacillus sp. IHB B 3415 TaxID=867080 RepID=UPI001F1875F4|nr:copper amine oxidase N-terminal domain-containing protein [Paenibacillus sp. IHB B 3415]